mgnify:CR=1 FL=1
MIRILYFAWVREAAGRDEEQVSPPAEVTTVGALLDWLAGRDAGLATAFADTARIRVAVDQEMATPDTPIGDVREIAIFPPVTGG